MLLIGLLNILVISSKNIFSKQEFKNIIRFSILIILYTLIILYNSFTIDWISNGILILNNNLFITSYTTIIKFLLLILSLIYFIILTNYNNFYDNSKFIKEYSLLILFNILSICLFIESINSLIIFITIELQSYSLYLITSTYYKNETTVGLNNAKNGLIYFLLGSLASIIILFGLTLIYNITGLINIIDISHYIINNPQSLNDNLELYIISFISIFIGLFYKIGLAPLHNWLINIYVNIPTIITVWISLVGKISILTFILTLNYLLSPVFNNIGLNILFQSFIIVSMIIGGLGGLSQFSIKRILAYSGLVNSGYLLLAIWANNQYSIFSYIFYIIQYSLTHMVIFMAVLFIIMYYNTWLVYKRENKNGNFTHNIYLNDIINILEYNKSLGIIFIICLTSFIGLPPLIGFYGKYYILIASLLSGYWLASLILILVSVITAYYYSYIIKVIFSEGKVHYNTSNISINYTYSIIMSGISLLILFPILYLDIYQNGLIVINYICNI